MVSSPPQWITVPRMSFCLCGFSIVLVWNCCLGFLLPSYVGRWGYLYDVITIAVLAMRCWQLHVSRCHNISPPPAVLAKGIAQAVWALCVLALWWLIIKCFVWPWHFITSSCIGWRGTHATNGILHKSTWCDSRGWLGWSCTSLILNLLFDVRLLCYGWTSSINGTVGISHLLSAKFNCSAWLCPEGIEVNLAAWLSEEIVNHPQLKQLTTSLQGILVQDRAPKTVLC